MDFITDFSGEYGFLSNFYPSIIRIPNASWEYPTVEHYFQANKTPRHSDAHRAIMEAKTPAEAKKLGRRLKIRQDWDEVKVGIMLAGLNYKFKGSERMAAKLLRTENAILIEGNTWGDRFWGQTLVSSSDSYKQGEGVGLNMLGVLLMHVRQSIAGGGFETRYKGD